MARKHTVRQGPHINTVVLWAITAMVALVASLGAALVWLLKA